MGFRFFRRIKLAPGLSLNLSRSGPSLSVGGRGLRYTMRPQDGTSRVTVGVPGTGVYYTRQVGSRGSKRGNVEPQPRNVQEDLRAKLHPGLLRRLTLSRDELKFLEGFSSLLDGEVRRALHVFCESDLADSCFMAGACAATADDHRAAVEYLSGALQRKSELGRVFSKFNLPTPVHYPIADFAVVELWPDEHGVRLLMAECYQELGQLHAAEQAVVPLYEISPDDPVVCLSLAEILYEAKKYQDVVGTTTDIRNEDFFGTTTLLYRARALRELGLYTAARDAYTVALRRRKNRPEGLLRTVRYERALVYQELGARSRYRHELERLYAQDPDWADVAERLGLTR